MQGYGTVRDVEETEKEGEKPVQECRIAECGQLPSDADLTSIPTFIAQVCATACEQHHRGSVQALYGMLTGLQATQTLLYDWYRHAMAKHRDVNEML